MAKITDLPLEVRDKILLLAAHANKASGVKFVYGLTERPEPPNKHQKTRYTKYVCGELPELLVLFKAFEDILLVCHDCPEKWANAPSEPYQFQSHEYNNEPTAALIRRDPLGKLRRINKFLAKRPLAARFVSELVFLGYLTPETDRLLISVSSHCTKREKLCGPWTLLRRGTVDDWISLLNSNNRQGVPLETLELTAVNLSSHDAAELERDTSPNPLEDPRVDFSKLKRLKIHGNTMTKPICDDDLENIARSATNLELLGVTNSTISIAGMLSLVRASRNTLVSLDHRPRSKDGFFPGSTSEHVCNLITSLPRLRDLSISVAHMCSAFFSKHEVNWQGQCLIRTTDICHCDNKTPAQVREKRLREIFAAARHLGSLRERLGHEISIQIRFGDDYVFEPMKRLIHGDLQAAEASSSGIWPGSAKMKSNEGPDRPTETDVDGKREGPWHAVYEDEWFYGLERGWVKLLNQ